MASKRRKPRKTQKPAKTKRRAVKRAAPTLTDELDALLGPPPKAKPKHPEPANVVRLVRDIDRAVKQVKEAAMADTFAVLDRAVAEQGG